MPIVLSVACAPAALVYCTEYIVLNMGPDIFALHRVIYLALSGMSCHQNGVR